MASKRKRLEAMTVARDYWRELADEMLRELAVKRTEHADCETQRELLVALVNQYERQLAATEADAIARGHR